MSLEKIVRPFQTGDVLKPRFVPPSQPANAGSPPEEAKLSWSGGTAGDYIQDPDPWLYNIDPAKNSWDEDPSMRVTELVRVENPDDPTQYVEIERIKQTEFQKRGTGERIRMNGINWDAGRKGKG